METNIDHIRNLPPEALADIIVRQSITAVHCGGNCDPDKGLITHTDCIKCCIRWLNEAYGEW